MFVWSLFFVNFIFRFSHTSTTYFIRFVLIRIEWARVRFIFSDSNSSNHFIYNSVNSIGSTQFPSTLKGILFVCLFALFHYYLSHFISAVHLRLLFCLKFSRCSYFNGAICSFSCFSSHFISSSCLNSTCKIRCSCYCRHIVCLCFCKFNRNALCDSLVLDKFQNTTFISIVVLVYVPVYTRYLRQSHLKKKQAKKGRRNLTIVLCLFFFLLASVGC